ncbi:DNA adenine methylase [Corynebacterium sp. CMW7794]|uniref:Site-specific DNA-methyltransferase (adenine-specific) n=1 Tax=Corynebacterium phoceense TaxID=1686286 RepID=A0A540R6X1_9CORY|nr:MULTISPECIES: DNA adenine methylase [Corynebacterium]KXI17663.1 DNA adenine methylase [Corynebacterium sp. CMW7794]TQE43490.1 DNA adenine methylase [Corynebacterium phoceense]
MTSSPKPLLKWVGGKRQLLPQIRAVVPDYDRYFEPFLGGGAVLFDLAPDVAVVGDLNSELINVYTVTRDRVDELIALLSTYPNDADFFYELRSLDRSPDYTELSDAARAARTIYLNKTCYNGLYRVNNAGQFNAPFGRYKNPAICDEQTLRAVSNYLRENDIQLINGDYGTVLEKAQSGDFVYLDPPYDPVTTTSNFTGYQSGGFSHADQTRLKEACDKLSNNGVNFLLSNSATAFIRELYKDYVVDTVEATRAINSVAAKRGKVDEVLVRNYGR